MASNASHESALVGGVFATVRGRGKGEAPFFPCPSHLQVFSCAALLCPFGTPKWKVCSQANETKQTKTSSCQVLSFILLRAE